MATRYSKLSPKAKAKKKLRDKLYYAVEENRNRMIDRITERYEKDAQFKAWKKFYNRERMRKKRAQEKEERLKAKQNGQEQPTQISGESC